MAKKKYEGMDVDDLDEDDLADLEEEAPVQKATRKAVRKVAKKPFQRYVAFATQARAGIADAETNEVLAEGDLGIYEMLAKIYIKLENIEKQVGEIMEE